MSSKKRCKWVGEDPLMIQYHDKEWGVPVKDDQKLFEFLILESAQAGLSWKTILHKRENYRKAYNDFKIEKIAAWTERKIQSLMQNKGIIRNEKKIRAAKNNAQAFIKIQEEFGSFASYQWAFVEGKPIINSYTPSKALPAKTQLSEEFAKDLKKRSFAFLGPTTVYSHMQACGMVHDHITGCFCYEKNIPRLKKFRL